MITQTKLKEILHYNPETGVFTWLIRPANRVKIGDIAGYKDNLGYIVIAALGQQYKAHRLAWLYMAGEWPKHQIDHISHIRHDNKWLNLRDATPSENQRNTTKRKDNTSGCAGVHWNKEREKWQSQIAVNGKTTYLGIFKDKFEAICCRKSASNKCGYHSNHGANL